MGSEMCFLFGILCGNVISKVAVSIDRSLLSSDAQAYCMEDDVRKEFRRLLPDHLRTLGPIVDVQRLSAVAVVKTSGDELEFTTDEELRQDAGGRWSK